MAYDESLVTRIRKLTGDRSDMDERAMFGGICFMCNGHMACGVEKDRLMVRVGPERYDELLAKPHASPMTFTGRPMRGFLFVAKQGLVREADLRFWVDLTLQLASSKPHKSRKPKLAAKRARKPPLVKEPAALPTFSGFSKATLVFLRGLAAHNHKTWFDAHRTEYEQHYLQVAIAFVAALGPRLRKLAPDIEFEPRVGGSMMRIHRDVRFAKDKTPYKPHIDLWFWQGERKGWEAPGFFLRLAPSELVLGCGMHRFDERALSRYRQAVLDPRAGKALSQLLTKLQKDGFVLEAPTRKRAPRGIAEDHPRVELLKREGLAIVDVGKHPKTLNSAALVDHCAERYRALVPLHTWLMREVMAR